MRLLKIFLAIILLLAIDIALKHFFHGPFQQMVFACTHPDDCLYSYFSIIWEYFGVQLIYNRGIAFGLPITGIFLQIITLAIIAGLCYYYAKYEFPKKNFWIDCAFVGIFSGALSHGYERIFQWYVIDFLSLKHFAIFNFADIAITVGGIIFLIYSFLYERK